MYMKRWYTKDVRFCASLTILATGIMLSGCAPASTPTVSVAETGAVVQTEPVQVVAPTEPSSVEPVVAQEPAQSTKQVESAPVANVAAAKNKLMLFGAVY